MKKKAYIQPHVTVVMTKHSVHLLAGSSPSDYKVSVSWDDETDEVD